MTEQKFDKTEAEGEHAATSQDADDQSLGAENSGGKSSQSRSLVAKIKSLIGGIFGGDTDGDEILISHGKRNIQKRAKSW